ncbi:MAG: NAD(P)H-dependent glycerol-3-phosphate dehydrogenase, partial [Steroidobacteraceae bacterium]
DLLIAVPSGGFRALLAEVSRHLEPQTRLAWATKGFESASGKLPHQVAWEVLGELRSIAVLSGPTFAREVGSGLPTAMTVASPDAAFAAALARDLSCGNFRAYTSTDIVGVEVGGAVKNVLAVGAGLSDGLGFGANTRVALITRGLVEMTRLGVALGAQRETFMGLAGLGDLVLTCTDDQSRNRRFGLRLAAGLSVEQALADIGQAVEGYLAAQAVHAVAAREGVDMPLCEAVYQVLYESRPARDVVRALMSRPIRAEVE